MGVFIKYFNRIQFVVFILKLQTK